MPTSSSLPSQPDLQQLRRQAKDLLRAHQAADTAAAQLLRHAFTEMADWSDAEIFQTKFALKDAQRAVARQYGFDEWADLKQHVDSLQKSDASAAIGGNSAEVEAIRRAVEAGDAETVTVLLEKNPGLVHVRLESDVAEGDTLLIRAVPNQRPPTPDQLQVAQQLIAAGADIDATGGSGDSAGSTALAKAAWLGWLEMVQLLLDLGADPDRENAIDQGRAIDTAAGHGHRQIVALLIAAGASYGLQHTIEAGLLKETRQLLDADPELVNEPLPDGHMPLTLAAGKQGIFNLLLRRGADIHRRDPRGNTPLLAARAIDNQRAIQLLLERGVSEDIFSAMAACNSDKVAALLQADPRVAHPVGDGPVPLLWAVHSGSSRIVELLLQQKVEVNIYRRDWLASTPLQAAISYQHDDIVRQLLDYGADPDPDGLEDFWNLPLISALRWGSLRSVAMILEAGADPNLNTPPNQYIGLCWPARGGHYAQVRLLMKWGADMQSPVSHRALAWAAMQGHILLVELFGAHGIDVEIPVNLHDDYSKGRVRTPLSRAQRKHPETAALIEEFIELKGLPTAQREQILSPRAEFIDAVLDGDADALQQVLAGDLALGQRPIVPRLLDIAAGLGHQAVADVLVAQGTPWSVAAAVALGRLEVLEALRKADPSFLQTVEPLNTAARLDRVDSMEWLLGQGAHIDRQAENGRTPLHQAVSSRSMQALECLLSRGANVHIQDERRNTPLGSIWPDGRQQRKIRQLLIAHGADPEE
ncbi:MAG: hypothetical protein GKR89_34000 [Candidatus Latescibacteria bacterium]|nr:hypothetical protein [Candidatus Latescibacterota bacterium]